MSIHKIWHLLGVTASLCSCPKYDYVDSYIHNHWYFSHYFGKCWGGEEGGNETIKLIYIQNIRRPDFWHPNSRSCHQVTFIYLPKMHYHFTEKWESTGTLQDPEELQPTSLTNMIRCRQHKSYHSALVKCPTSCQSFLTCEVTSARKYIYRFIAVFIVSHLRISKRQYKHGCQKRSSFSDFIQL